MYVFVHALASMALSLHLKVCDVISGHMMVDGKWCVKIDMTKYLNDYNGYTIAVGHTIPNAPDPIRTLKLSGIRHG